MLFCGHTPFLNLFWVTMEAMHFYIAQTGNTVLGQLCFAFRALNKPFGTHDKLSWGLNGYCKSKNFRESFIFANSVKRHICDV